MQEATEIKTPWMKVVAFASAVALIAGLFTNFNDIAKLYKEWLGAKAPTVRVGWMTASSVSSLEKCILPNGSTFELDKRLFSLGQNECLSSLKQRMVNGRKPGQVEDVRSARFLLLENTGGDIQRIKLLGTSDIKPLERVRGGENTAVCVAIQGKMGGKSLEGSITKIAIARAGSQEEVIEVPQPSVTLARGISTCESIVYNAPI